MKKTVLYLVFFIFILTGGCKEEEDPLIAPTEHFDPVGWFLHDEINNPILVIWEGEIQKTWNGITVSDTLFGVTNGATPPIYISFLEEDKSIVENPRDDDYTPGWIITDTTITDILDHEGANWAFHISGKKAGITTIELQVLHQGHADVRTPKIPVRIE